MLAAIGWLILFLPLAGFFVGVRRTALFCRDKQDALYRTSPRMRYLYCAFYAFRYVVFLGIAALFAPLLVVMLARFLAL